MELEMQEQILSAKDVAKILNINRNSVYYQIKIGSLPKPTMKIKMKKNGPHSYVWKRSDLEGTPYFDRLSNTPDVTYVEACKAAMGSASESTSVSKAFVQQYSNNVQMLSQQMGERIRNEAREKQESSIENLYEMVGDNELLRDAIEMRVDKLEQDVRMLQSIYELLKQKKEKKWWQI